MKRSSVNELQTQVTPMRRKMDAAGSERGQQIVPAIVGIIWVFYL